MIQREAGVSKSTVYAHYANKEALFVAVIEAECAAFTNTVRGIGFRPGKLRETLTMLARAYLDIVLSPGGLAVFRVVIAEGPRFPKLARTFYLAGPQVMTTMVSEQLARAAASGEVDLGEIGRDTAASLFINLVRGEPQLQCLTHPDAAPSSAQIDQWANAAVVTRSEEHTSELQSLMRISYAVFCLIKTTNRTRTEALRLLSVTRGHRFIAHTPKGATLLTNSILVPK